MAAITDRHVAKHRPKSSDLDARDKTVRLSDEVMRRFAELYEATCDEKCTFDAETHVSIKALGTWQEQGLKDLLLELPRIALETERYAVATGDGNARNALARALEALGQERSITVTRDEPRRQHTSSRR